MSTTPAARITDATKRYRKVAALDGVTTEVRSDVVTGLLGRNGSGKSTLLTLLAGHQLPTSGEVEVLGGAPYENPAVLERICLVRESQRYSSFYRVIDVLTAARLLRPAWDQAFADELLDEFDLPRTRGVKKLSLGMRSAVGCIVGLASRAPVTMFDEPTTGLDAVARRIFHDRLLADHAEHPRTIVLSTHLIDEVADLVNHALVLHRGRVVLDGDAEELGRTLVTVTGPGDVVERYVTALEVVRRETLGGTTRATVVASPSGVAAAARPDLDEARRLGLDVGRTSLQDVVVHLTSGPAPDPGDRPGPASTGRAAT